MILSRKTFFLSLTFSLGLGLVNYSYAGLSTEYSYERDNLNFCDKATTQMNALNEANKNNMERLNELKLSIEQKAQERAIILQVLAMKKNYFDGYEKIIRDGSRTGLFGFGRARSINPDILKSSLDDMKKTIKNGLALSAIKHFLKENIDFKDPNLADNGFDCRTVTGNQIAGLCNKNKIDPIIKSFKAAYDGIGKSNQSGLVTQISGIMNSIPPELNPDDVLNYIQKNAPESFALLTKDVSRKDIEQCLGNEVNEETLSACRKISSETNRESFIEGLSKETNNLTNNTDEKLSEVLKNATYHSNLQINLAMKNFKQNDENKTIANEVALLSKTIQNAATTGGTVGLALTNVTNNFRMNVRQQSQDGDSRNLTPNESDGFCESSSGLSGLSVFFCVDPVDDTKNYSPEILAEKQAAAAAAANEDARIWKEKCEKPQPTDVHFCHEKMKILSSRVDSLHEKSLRDIKRLSEDVKKIQNDPNFYQIETLKKYIAEKYLRVCKDNNQIKKIETNISRDISCVNIIQPITALEGLNNAFANIYSKLSGDKYNDNQVFSGEELQAFQKACISNIPDSIKATCDSIKNENAEVKRIAATTPQAPDIYALNSDPDYVAVYRPGGGIIKMPRKTPGRIIGEGVVPVLPGLIGGWLNTMQTQNYINTLTPIAIYQKQQLYVQDMINANPWAYQDYFQSYTGMPTAGSTAGFNFGLGN